MLRRQCPNRDQGTTTRGKCGGFESQCYATLQKGNCAEFFRRFLMASSSTTLPSLPTTTSRGTSLTCHGISARVMNNTVSKMTAPEGNPGRVLSQALSRDGGTLYWRLSELTLGSFHGSAYLHERDIQAECSVMSPLWVRRGRETLPWHLLEKLVEVLLFRCKCVCMCLCACVRACVEQETYHPN